MPYTFTVNRSGSTTGTSSVAWVVTASGSNRANAADFTGGVMRSGTQSVQVNSGPSVTVRSEATRQSPSQCITPWGLLRSAGNDSENQGPATIHVNIVGAWISNGPYRCSRSSAVQVNPKLAVDNRADLLLGSKALKAVIDAVHHQLEIWQDVSEADIDEDALADLHIAYLEIILHR